MTLGAFCRHCGGSLISRYTDGRARQVCPDCGLVAYENPVPATAAVVRNQAGDILLVLRNSPPHKGGWCLPGGFLETDESPEAGCLRELEEETGLTGEVTNLIGLEIGENPLYKSVLVIGYQVMPKKGELCPGDDSDEARYFPVNALPHVVFRSHRRLLERSLSLHSLEKRSPGSWGAYVITSGDHVRLTAEACGGGARVIQFREKKMSRRRMLETAIQLRKITRESGAQLIVNDAIDIAMMSEADGVHLGQDDIPVRDARRLIAGNMLIGVSTHSLEQALLAQQSGADYIGIGPVFETPTKADYPPIGKDTVRLVLARIRIPVVVIGGIDEENIREIIALGARNIAMVRAFSANPSGLVSGINKMVAAGFDSVGKGEIPPITRPG